MLKTHLNKNPTLATSDTATVWDDLGVTYVARVIRKRRWLMVMIPILWIVISNVTFLLTPRMYAAELQVVPAALNSSGSSSNLLSKLGGGLPSLLGDLSNDGMFDIYIESWKAPWLAESLAEDQSLMRRIFPEQWSDKDEEWRQPLTLKGGIKRLVYGIFGAKAEPWHAPGGQELLDYLDKSITVQNNSSKFLMARIIAKSRDPSLPADLLAAGHKQINLKIASTLRDRAVENSQYLLKKMQQITIAELRSELAHELVLQERTQMLAFSNEEFAADSYGIHVPKNAVSPNPFKLLLSSLIISIVVYLAAVLLIERRSR